MDLPEDADTINRLQGDLNSLWGLFNLKCFSKNI
jgi:hypothetical protein